jgi:hypothetical protein
MILELTDQQAQEVNQGYPVEVVDQASNCAFVVVSRERYESIRSHIEREELVAETRQPVVPDTARAYSFQQMARAWKSIGRQVAEDEVPLSVDPDDYPLF